MKILINCYACSPYKGSEPGMGWNFVKNLAEKHELHVIMETKFQKEVDRYYEEHPEETKNFKIYPINRTRLRTLRKIWPPSYYWTYRAWQKKVLAFAKELDEKEHFDIIHQLNMVGYREPGYLWMMDKPIVWGPIGGFNITPWNMLTSMGLYGVLFYGGRNMINLWQMHTMSRVKKAAKRADAIITATQDCHDAVKKLYNRDSIIIPEVGLLGKTDVTPAKRADDEPLRICWSGQHTPGKSLNLLLDALALIPNENVELHVIGKGSQTNKWKKKAANLGLKNVVWHGWMQRCDALKVMQSSHLFAITSMCDLTSTVILEALSYGLPVVAMDHCGFSNVINKDCGIKIPVTDKGQITKDLSEAIVELAGNEAERQRLSTGALTHAKDFAWEEKARQIDVIYNNIAKK